MRVPRLGILFALVCSLVTVMFTVSAQFGVRAVVINEFSNIRLIPAIGAEVLDTVEAGYVFETVTARSADAQWIRVIYASNEGWVNIAPLLILEGDVEALPVADPRSIPYGGFDAPRSGYLNNFGGASVAGRATAGLRIRSGPSRAYITIGNINRNEGIMLTGRFADTSWYQVLYDGTVGWVAARYVEVLDGNINALPVDGIVAESPPIITDSGEDYIALLRLMLERLDLAQPSLDQIRASWTDAALTGRAQCTSYPARPSDIAIAQPLLAANYVELEPIQRDFNDAMFNIRFAIDLFIEVCNQPGTENLVGQATAAGALEAINLAERQFASLRDRITPLLPSGEPGIDECLLNFNGRTEILPVIRIGQIYLEEFGIRKNVAGYCFDALEGQVLDFQALPVPGSSVSLFMSISPLDSPKDFVSLGEGAPYTRLNVSNITIPRLTRYVLIIAHLGDAAPGVGQFAFRLQDTTFAPVVELLIWNPDTNAFELTTDPEALYDAGLGPAPATPDPLLTPGGGAQPDVVCPSLAFTCIQFVSCSEAYACYDAGNFSLDADADGVPCEAELACQPR
ncbi:SH3 domain-containing protein [Phototrophicus methaneseepsis]|uniref:SH3 domain-containing protein n=1 Tax=Phototrophicus methaneseepsis TaxID=2710758 RepID=A0A7S8IF24_9CHLR|nr:SH3 domain-containing protein [Phototrophicus methaneseepsis]QPC84270.1 SH3 domain-containing protein [Phototrophicus methaneseepsis]